jgi:hypothetical protein
MISDEPRNLRSSSRIAGRLHQDFVAPIRKKKKKKIRKKGKKHVQSVGKYHGDPSVKYLSGMILKLVLGR